MTTVNKRTAKQKITELCKAHSELEKVNAVHSGKEGGSDVLTEFYSEKVIEIEKQIVVYAKTLFEQNTSSKK
jgi:hypothetical protein